MREKKEGYFFGFVLVCAILALIYPEWFMLAKPFLSLALALVMFGIGIHIPTGYLTQTLSRSKRVIGLVLLRYMVMPLAAYCIAKTFHLSLLETMGLLVLGAAPGGISANMMAYLAGANTALTVLLTLGSTLLAPFAMPLLIYFFLHQQISIDVWTMVLHIGSIMVIPIFAGILCHRHQTSLIGKIKQTMPILTVLLFGFLIGYVIAANQKALLDFPIWVLLAVFCLNLSGYILGGLVSYSMQWERASICAAVFDYGMFDGALAMVVCTVFIGPEAAIPAVLMGVLQNLTAPVLVYASKQKIRT